MKRPRLDATSRQRVHEYLRRGLASLNCPESLLNAIDAGNPSLFTWCCRWLARTDRYAIHGCVYLPDVQLAFAHWVAYKCGVREGV